MPRLRFPILPDGLIVDVLVNLDGAEVIAARSRGEACPPFQGKGIIDTASNVSAATLVALRSLGATPQGQSTTKGIGGTVPVDLYRVSLHIRDANDPTLTMFTVPSLLVMEFPAGLDEDVLIGRDVLRLLKMVADGPHDELELHF